MGFPTIDNWQKQVIAPGDEQFKARRFYDYYRGKFEICRAVAPARIAEIGVRYGYSAFSFLAASPGAEYTGYDVVAGCYGGVKANTFVYVCDLLRRHYPEAQVELIYQDSREMESLGGPFDFVHVDANHREEVCRHDMELALAACCPGGVILVDDYTYIAGVTRAVDRFVLDNASAIERHYSRPSLRGEYIIEKQNDEARKDSNGH